MSQTTNLRVPTRSLCFLANFLLAALNAIGQGLPPGVFDAGYAPDGRHWYGVATQALVPPSDMIRDNNWPPCWAPANDILTQAAAAFVDTLDAEPELAFIAGVITQELAGQLEQFAATQPGFLAELVAPNRKASCTPLAVVVPGGSELVYYQLYSRDVYNGWTLSWMDGNGWMLCGIGWCGWENVPKLGTVKRGADQLVGAVFKNWSADRARFAFLRVYFVPPADWTPISASVSSSPLGVNLAAYCQQHGYSSVVNLDNTGYGWRCTPGNASISVDEACKEQYGPSFSSRLTSPPPGKPYDWICVR
jgi:hypothetical protein